MQYLWVRITMSHMVFGTYFYQNDYMFMWNSKVTEHLVFLLLNLALVAIRSPRFLSSFYLIVCVHMVRPGKTPPCPCTILQEETSKRQVAQKPYITSVHTPLAKVVSWLHFRRCWETSLASGSVCFQTLGQGSYCQRKKKRKNPGGNHRSQPCSICSMRVVVPFSRWVSWGSEGWTNMHKVSWLFNVGS